MMKRSEFGFNEWCQFAGYYTHKFNRVANRCLLISNRSEYCYETEDGIDEAARVTIEMFCKAESKVLPWEPDKPDFATWSINMCEQYLKEQKCNWRTHNDYTEESHGGNFAIELQQPFNGGFGCEIGGPKVIDYQRAAEYVWTQVNK